MECYPQTHCLGCNTPTAAVLCDECVKEYLIKHNKKFEFYTYWGFGFPVVLCNPNAIESRGVWMPDVNLKDLQENLYGYLSERDDLSDAEREFIRKYERK